MNGNVTLKVSEAILEKALNKWGSTSQECMAIEECSEFIHAMTKLYRKRHGVEEVAEEIADVIIMMLQMRLLFGPEMVDKFLEKKINRLEELLKAERD